MTTLAKLASGTALAALFALGAPSRPVDAQLAVVCATCSNLVTQIVQDAREALEYAKQIQQYQTQLQQYANMIQNTVALPTMAWNQVQNDIMQVKALSDAGSVLTGHSSSMVQRLQNASAYSSQVANLGNMAGQFEQWQTTIGNNVSTFGKTLGLQQDQANSDAALIRQMQSHSDTADGQMKAIQAGNELASANANALLKVQQTLITTAQMQASNYATQADKTALEDAARLHFAEPVTTAVTGQNW